MRVGGRGRPLRVPAASEGAGVLRQKRQALWPFERVGAYWLPRRLRRGVGLVRGLAALRLPACLRPGGIDPGDGLLAAGDLHGGGGEPRTGQTPRRLDGGLSRRGRGVEGRVGEAVRVRRARPREAPGRSPRGRRLLRLQRYRTKVPLD